MPGAGRRSTAWACRSSPIAGTRWTESSGRCYVTLEGVLGVPLDVAATYIVLFTIYGAVVERGGAGRFFLDWSMAATGSRGRVNPGRTVTVAGYLLGALSGSGVANTVTLGAVAWPLMRKAGYGAEPGGAVLAAAGIGAILAPPVMGATAFLMAEFLKVAYFDIAMMAILPAALYYGSLLVVVEADARRSGVTMRAPDGRSLGAVTRSGWHHFVSFVVMVALMVRGVTAFLAVFWATVVACAASFRNRDEALVPRRLAAALTAGGLSVVPIVATTAAAGIIVGVITLTGLGLKAASLIVTLAGASRILTTLYAALAVWALGLAVPVTACYIIAAVMVAPALTQVGISVEAAHMFVFYYAVLSEVSPPTALSPFAAAAITGGNPFRTTMLTWKYAIPGVSRSLRVHVDPDGRGAAAARNGHRNCGGGGDVCVRRCGDGHWRRGLFSAPGHRGGARARDRRQRDAAVDRPAAWRRRPGSADRRRHPALPAAGARRNGPRRSRSRR